MKFQVREGYVVRFNRKIEIDADKFELQEVTAYAGQTIDLTQAEAEGHAHKLESKDKAAAEFLAAKVLPTSPGSALGLQPEAIALVSEMARQILAGLQAQASAPAATPAAAG